MLYVASLFKNTESSVLAAREGDIMGQIVLGLNASFYYEK